MPLLFLVLALVCVFLGLPQWLQVVMALANCFVPDFVPLIDEVIMLAIAFR